MFLIGVSCACPFGWPTAVSRFRVVSGGAARVAPLYLNIPRGSKYPNSRALFLKIHTLNSFWGQR